MAPYEALHEASNYVLFVTKDTFRNGEQWTTFQIFSIQLYWPGDYTSLRSHLCTYWNSMRSSAPFDWPVGKLLAMLKKSRCLTKIEVDATATFGWSYFIFQRYEKPNARR